MSNLLPTQTLHPVPSIRLCEALMRDAICVVQLVVMLSANQIPSVTPKAEYHWIRYPTGVAVSLLIDTWTASTDGGYE